MTRFLRWRKQAITLKTLNERNRDFATVITSAPAWNKVLTYAFAILGRNGEREGFSEDA
jgi:hypothetical protein